ncbi:hypothetical protein F0L68_31355 [Solihabitans fulvus]|uniref:ABC-2 type transport system permease protein n=1 Tax=Solihabitans fulvus TaxID=1892852 RepID=A0A5B2WRI0_9PSEU|nr:hypothetical protein [Solihabitans fulvus]KAA2254105.1 hypothetical protein F0L68_31355 [Solihabitans fulvus]
MTALVRYLLADLVRSQRYLPVVIAFLAVLGVLYSGDPGDPVSAYAGSCVMVYPIAAWFAVVVATAEDPVQRTVTAVTAGGWGRLQVGVAGLATLGAVTLSVLGAVAPVLISGHPYGPVEVAIGLGAHLSCSFTGTAVGLLVSRPVINRIGWTAVAAMGIVVITFPLKRMPPVGAVLGLLSDRDVGHALPVLAGSGALAAVLLVVATAVSRFAARRS